MIFIIDIDCCVFFWFQGAFFLGGWDCAAEAWPSRVRWGLAGWIGFFLLVEVDQVELFTEFTGWVGSGKNWHWNILKYIEIIEDRWGDPCALGDPHPRWGVRRRCRGAKVSRKSVGRFQGSGMCMLYVICMCFTWCFDSNMDLFLGFFHSNKTQIFLSKKNLWYFKIGDSSPLLARRCSQTCRTSPVRRRFLAALGISPV